MNIQHLHYAVEIAKTGSISQAAENLYMGQPNLSKAIKELEESLGIHIFKRSSRGVMPTKEGEEFLVHARNILLQIGALEDIYSPAGRERQNFRISVPRSSYIAHAFTTFVAGLDMEKEMEIDFRETNSMQAISNIEEEGFKLGIIRYSNEVEPYFLHYMDKRNLSFREIWEFEYLALFSKHSRLGEQETIVISDLGGYIELVHGDLSVPYLSKRPDGIEEPKSEISKKRIYVYERGSELDLLSRVPETYMWVSPMPKDILERNGLVQRAVVKERQIYKDVLVFPSSYSFTELDEAFFSALQQSKAEAADFAQLESKQEK